MLGRQGLEKLSLDKQVLLLESGLNRLALQAEFRILGSEVTRLTRGPRGAMSLLMILAPFAGMLLARRARPSTSSASWITRVMSAAKWAVPLFRLLKGFAAKRDTAGAEKPSV